MSRCECIHVMLSIKNCVYVKLLAKGTFNTFTAANELCHQLMWIVRCHWRVYTVSGKKRPP